MDAYEKHVLQFNRELNFTSLQTQNLEQLKKQPAFDGLIIVGMGGSGLTGSLFKGLVGEKYLKVPVIVWKNFGLPPLKLKKPFYVFVSFSGQTPETISGLKQLLARHQKRNVAIVTTGGELKTLAQKMKLPLVAFPARDLTPREALGKMYYSLIKILLTKKIPLQTQELTPIIKPLTLKNQGRQIARALKNRIPLIYTDTDHGFLGYIWKINLNETAKQPAFANVLPELAHNEINAFEKRKFPFSVIFLKDPRQSKTIQRKTAATEKVLRKNHVPCLSITLKGKTEEEKIWNSIVLSHLTSFYLAKINKIDPTQTRLIDQLKKLTK